MRPTLIKQSGLWIALLLMACVLSIPVRGHAQGRGHGRGLDKKTVKFINGHDARAGRWDGRGPRPRWDRSIRGARRYGYTGWRKHSRKQRSSYRAYRR
jgi:hypothetical protein